MAPILQLLYPGVNATPTLLLYKFFSDLRGRDLSHQLYWISKSFLVVVVNYKFPQQADMGVVVSGSCSV